MKEVRAGDTREYRGSRAEAFGTKWNGSGRVCEGEKTVPCEILEPSQVQL